ncbi:integrase catalytic domain-containing protein [Trichonephila clavipes]|nr:integrase catalytic domain-containing protein [Trichonephila clavipes]
MGIRDTEKNMLDSDNDNISSFENNLKFNNGMYETKLFWEDKPSDLENNWAIAKRRFGNLSIKMQDNNWLYNEYKNIVKDQINQNIVEECSSHFETNSYYMPHSAVVRKDKETTKVRMVFDASSKGAFLTIGIAEEDRDYLRFFWFPYDGDAKSYKIMRMNRVPFGVTLSPFILAATIKFHIRKYKEDYRETYELLNTSLYVDDLFAGSSESVYKAFDLSKDAIEILKDANMNLRKFKTSSKELRKLWNENGIGDVCESGVQVTAPLPALRVEQSAPFSVVGIDFGGPLYTKDENKHYIVLFTCAVTRALHLELVNNLTTETFLLALRRFISHRGLCSKILTDNAKTFKKSELELKNLWKIISDPTVKAFYASHKIYWQFIMERAPWWGGFYERLIRTVKLALRKTVGRATLFRDELETLLIEIEGGLNSRPLTYIFSEFNEPEPLTPSHMILGRRVNSLPPARLNFDSNLSNRKVLIKRFNYREILHNMFWTKWSKEYICMLKSAHCVKPTGEIKEFKIDDVVLINDEKFPRHFWKLGKVVDVFPGRDVAAVAEWYRYRIVACLVTSLSPVPLKTRLVGQRCTLNLSRAETTSRWCGVVVRRAGASSGVVHVT